MTSGDTMWKDAVITMKNAIRDNNQVWEFLKTFEPNENEGYCFDMNPQYRHCANYLDNKTGGIHSGASFAVCLRAALEDIHNEEYNPIIVKGNEIQNSSDDEAVKVISVNTISESKDAIENPIYRVEGIQNEST